MSVTRLPGTNKYFSHCCFPYIRKRRCHTHKRPFCTLQPCSKSHGAKNIYIYATVSKFSWCQIFVGSLIEPLKFRPMKFFKMKKCYHKNFQRLLLALILIQNYYQQHHLHVQASYENFPRKQAMWKTLHIILYKEASAHEYHY